MKFLSRDQFCLSKAYILDRSTPISNTIIHLLYLPIANIFMILNNIFVINILKIVSIRRAIKDTRARGNHNCKRDCVANILALNLQISRNIGQVVVSAVIFN